jgi:F0F1-type ATP synthase assembly protein I
MMNSICILVRTGLGWLVGHQLGTGPALLLIGMVLAIACGALAPIGKYASTSKTDWRLAT